MTQNQIRYWELQEAKRHNASTEAETARNNRTVEAETNRANLAKEAENYRTNLANENIRSENNLINWYGAQTTRQHYQNMDAETNRHNIVSEGQNQTDVDNRGRKTDSDIQKNQSDIDTNTERQKQIQGDNMRGWNADSRASAKHEKDMKILDAQLDQIVTSTTGSKIKNVSDVINLGVGIIESTTKAIGGIQTLEALFY